MMVLITSQPTGGQMNTVVTNGQTQTQAAATIAAAFAAGNVHRIEVTNM
jgi:hypothetical protein